MAQAKRKKKFFEIEIPIIEKTTQLFGYDLEEFNGKFMKYDLSRILRGKGMEVQLKVLVKDGEAIALPKKAVLFQYFIKRVNKKNTT